METPCHTGYLGELQAERGDLDLPQPPEGLQGEHRGAAGQKLYKREEAEVIITDEELQQDVQGAREHAVRHGHGNSQKSALEHIHDGGQKGVGVGEPCHGVAWTGWVLPGAGEEGLEAAQSPLSPVRVRVQERSDGET